MSDNNRQLLTDPDRGLRRSRNVLTFLWRRILKETNLSLQHWNRLMDRYLDDPTNNIPRNSRERSSARGNLNKELFKDVMTWKVFEKAIRFINPKALRFEVHLTGWNNKTMVVGVDVPLRRSVVDDPQSAFFGFGMELPRKENSEGTELDLSDSEEEFDEEDEDDDSQGQLELS